MPRLFTVLPLQTYYGLSISGHHVAVNNVSKWGDSIILCDLEEAGIMKDGHVIPEASGQDAAWTVGQNSNILEVARVDLAPCGVEMKVNAVFCSPPPL